MSSAKMRPDGLYDLLIDAAAAPCLYGKTKRNFTGQHFWARGFLVSTVGRDEHQIREYIRNQERGDERLEKLELWR